MLFNTMGVLLFAWTLPLFERTLRRLVPDKASPVNDPLAT